jgi:phosphoglycerate dehydrogenase-like enzyme
MKQIVCLDDYQNVALTYGDWGQLKGRANVRSITRNIADRAELLRELADANVLVCNRERTVLDKAVIDALPNLELIVTSGLRNASIDVAAANARGITVCGTQTLGYPTAELTWAMILGYMRDLPNQVNSLASGGWQTKVGVGVRGKTLGILGYGRIGSEVAKVGLALGMKVVAWSRSLTPEKAAAAGVECASKEEVLKQSDVVTVHLVLNKELHHFIGAADLALMKPTALFVNTSRSGLVDTAALIAALKEGKLGGAALDVYDREPLPKDDPIRTAPRTMLTPHLGYVIEESYKVTYPQSLEDILAWMDGKPLRVITPNAPAGH